MYSTLYLHDVLPMSLPYKVNFIVYHFCPISALNIDYISLPNNLDLYVSLIKPLRMNLQSASNSVYTLYLLTRCIVHKPISIEFVEFVDICNIGVLLCVLHLKENAKPNDLIILTSSGVMWKFLSCFLPAHAFLPWKRLLDHSYMPYKLSGTYKSTSNDGSQQF